MLGSNYPEQTTYHSARYNNVFRLAMKIRFVLGRFCPPQIIKFLTTGILNTVIGNGIYAVLLFADIPYLVALLFATITGVIFNYFSYGYIVFNGYTGRLVLCKFTITYLIIFSLNAIGLSVLIRYFFLSPYAAQLICIPPNILLSWLLMKCWVFKRL